MKIKIGPIDTTKRKKLLSTRVPAEILRVLEQLAREEGQKISPFIERLLVRYVKDRERESAAA